MHASSFTAKGAAPPEAKWQWERRMEIGEWVNVRGFNNNNYSGFLNDITSPTF
jgi:hypothetical protein